MIVAWAAAACCKAAETRVACYRALNFFRGVVAGSSLSGAGPIWGAAIECPVGKDVWFWTLAQAGVHFYGMPIRLEEIVSPNTKKWQRFAVVNGRWALFPSSRPALTA